MGFLFIRNAFFFFVLCIVMSDFSRVGHYFSYCRNMFNKIKIILLFSVNIKQL